MEEIIDIKEFDNDDEQKAGYKITTNKQEIIISISNGQNCCENWGYITSEDYFPDFFGAELLGIILVNTELKKDTLLGIDFYDDEENCLFVNVETSKGTIQFILYNSHNGYYGHSVLIKSTQLNYEGDL